VLRILGVVHFDAAARERVAAIACDANIDALLVDSSTTEAVGGTGTSYDWGIASKPLQNTEGRRPLIAAGGLTPDNVPRPLRRCAMGVDVVSGVKRRRAEGCGKVQAFIANARAAQT